MKKSSEQQKLRLSQPEWLSHYESWKQSKLSKAAYCRKHDLATENFYYWCQRIEKQPASKDASPFLPLVSKKASPEINTDSLKVTLLLSNNTHLQVSLTMTMLIKLIRELSDATTIIW